MSAVERSIAVLRAFSAARPELGLGELAALTRLDKATVLRLLKALCAGGLVYRSGATGMYRLGHEILSLAEVAKSSSPLVMVARPHMRAVRDRLDETVVVAARADDFRVNLEQLQALRPVRRVVAIGIPTPLYFSASGRVMLADFPDAELTEYLARAAARAPNVVTEQDQQFLRAELARIAAQGFAEAINEAASDGAAFSAPIRDHTGHAVGAFTVSIPLSRFNAGVRGHIVEAITGAAAAVSREIGGPAIGPGKSAA